jgi:hypothetical protein
MADPQELPNDHSRFIETFVSIAGEKYGNNSHDPGASKRQRILTEVTETGLMTAPLARYTIGGDDNMYMQLGLSVLHTATPEQALAPAALYNLDAVHAIRDGIKRRALSEIKRRETESDDRLEAVRSSLMTIFGVMGLDDYMEDGDKMTDLINSPYEPSKRAEFTKLLQRLYAALDSELADRIEIDIYYGNTPTDLAVALFFAAKNATKENSDDESEESLYAVQDIDSSVVKYAIARGLCGHRSPMEKETDCPMDRLLPYDAPRGIAVQVGRAKSLRLPEGCKAPEIPSNCRDRGTEEAMAALAGNYAIDDVSTDGARSATVKDARQVRWTPNGPHGVALAKAAVLEHAVARCTQLLTQTDSTLSPDAQRSLVRARLSLKVRQLDALHELSCAVEDGDVLHHVPKNKLVTRPVATIRGKLHYAHDAGHHDAPPTATVLLDQRWTVAHARADAEFRKQNNNEASGIAVYKAPGPHELGYIPVTTTGATAVREEPHLDPTDERYFHRTIFESIKKLLEYGLYYADVPDPVSFESTLNGSSAPQNTNALGTANARRSGIWNEMLRDIAISTDRLWTFVRTLSGLIGEDADSLLVTADEASAAAARDLQAQRKATADRVAAFQGKIVEGLIGSLMKESGLRLDTSPKDAADSLVVINGETAKQINDLASGESGRPFFEANVALRSLTERGAGGKHKLGDVVAQFNGVVRQLHADLDAELLSPQTAGASLAELSIPRNSYFVRLREDTTAAIRSAYDKFSVEMSIRGVGRICLWELIEGADHTLCTRFAELVGHVLVQNRTSTGVSALYASRQQLTVNGSQALVSLQRLINQASHYKLNHPSPIFEASTAGTLKDMRDKYFESHRGQQETWAGTTALSAIAYARDRHLKLVEQNFRPIEPSLSPWVFGYR